MREPSDGLGGHLGLGGHFGLLGRRRGRRRLRLVGELGEQLLRRGHDRVRLVRAEVTLLVGNLGHLDQGGEAVLGRFVVLGREVVVHPLQAPVQLRHVVRRHIGAADLIGGATSGTRATWLGKKYYNETGTGFKSSRKLVPISSRRDEFQELIDRYVEESGVSVPARAAASGVKDVAERRGQGTASLGLVRYYVMIEGPLTDASDDILLELKQARRSALEGLVPPSEHLVDGNADRVVHGQRVQLVSGDRFYGSIKHRGTSFLVRERSWFRDDIDLDDLSFKQWRHYARICGEVLAQAHARSDESGLVDHDVEPDIVDAMGRPGTVRRRHRAVRRRSRQALPP